MSWRHIPVSLTELCIDTTLRCGQSFRWRKSDDGIWSCALHGRLLSLRQDDSHLYYQVRWPETKSTRKVPLTPPSSIHSLDDATTSDVKDDTEAFIRHYLNLAPNLTSLYEQWSQADSNFKKKAPRFAGVRILRQDAWEALVGFICSSNNNIARISQMMEKLCIHYGTRIGALDGREFHDMPTPAALTGEEVEAHLRELGFGYRAKYLRRTAAAIVEREEEEGTGWLDRLRNPESPAFSGVAPEEKKGKSSSKVGKEELPPGGREGYRHAHEQLLALQGVGPKVADCVCLMGLGWGEAIPVDTHVWQIAVRDYRFGKGKHASLTKATYDAIGDQFRKLWGKEAGWAHSVLFAADLRTFAERLTAKIEIKEDVIKTEKETVIKTEETIKTEVASPEKKRRRNNEQLQLLDGAVIEEKTAVRTTRSKRRRQG